MPFLGHRKGTPRGECLDMRRICVLVAIAVLACAGPARAARPEPDVEPVVCPRTDSPAPGTHFEVDGPGSQAFVGGWRVDDNQASLCFRGAGGVSGKTTIDASWRTPWLASDAPEWSDSYEFATANPTDDVKLHFTLRSRFKGEEWGRWFGHEHRSPAPVGGGGGFSAAGFIFLSVGRPSTPPPIQWEWRVEIEVAGPGAMDMSATMEQS